MTNQPNHPPTTEYHPWATWPLDLIVFVAFALAWACLSIYRLISQLFRTASQREAMHLKMLSPEAVLWLQYLRESGLEGDGGVELDRQRAKLERSWSSPTHTAQKEQ